MIRRTLSILPFLILTAALAAQGLKWSATSFRFPVSTEQHKALHNTFTFQNVSDSSINILKISSSTDVFISNFSKGVIPPGGKGFVKASLTPSLISGDFTRTITVLTDDPGYEEYTLTLEGEIRIVVDPKTEEYPLAIGNLRHKPFYHLFFDLKNTEIRTDTIYIYNAWETEMTMKFSDVPEWITIKPVPTKLKPKGDGILLVTYDAVKRNDFDMLFDQVTLITNDIHEPEKKLGIIAVIVDDFSKYENGDFSNAPVARFSALEYNFGTIKQGYIARYSLELTNTGKDTLIIRKTNATCGCTIGRPDKDKLAPGESTNIQVSFNTYGRKGSQNHSVTFITNDPRNPSQVFTITGFVE